MKDTHTLHMRLMEKRDNAVKVTAAKRAEPGVPIFYHWIPRSLIAYSRIEPSPVPGEFAYFTFTLPEWKIEQIDLWDFVRPRSLSTARSGGVQPSCTGEDRALGAPACSRGCKPPAQETPALST